MESKAATSLLPPIYTIVVPDVIVPATVKIIPTSESNPAFVLSGHGDHWSAAGEDLTLHLPSQASTPIRVRYNVTFMLSSSGYTFASPALEIFQGDQGAFICQPAQSEGATVTVSFLNAVNQGSEPVIYNLGFRINTPNGTINWDPQVAFNPPD